MLSWRYLAQFISADRPYVKGSQHLPVCLETRVRSSRFAPLASMKSLTVFVGETALTVLNCLHAQNTLIQNIDAFSSRNGTLKIHELLLT